MAANVLAVMSQCHELSVTGLQTAWCYSILSVIGDVWRPKSPL